MFKKILTILVAFSLLCIPVHAQWSDEYEMSDFSKLLSNHLNPFLIGPNAAVEARNLRSNVKFGELTKRSDMDTYAACGSFKVTGLHRYYQVDGDQYVICSGSTVLKTDKNEDKTFIEIRDELTDGARWQFVTFQGNVLMVNGTDANQKYDGHSLTTANTDAARTASILTADLGAPYAELNTGANLDASSWYQYRMAHYDGTTYSYSTARSNPILTGAAVRDIYLTDIPLGPAGTTNRYIYRTDGNASRAAVEADSTFKLIATISDNSTKVLADTTADGSVDTPLWSTVAAGTNVTPPVAKFIIIHKERVILARNPTFPSDIYWSYPYRANIFDPVNFEPIRDDDGDEITGILNQSGVIVIFKENSVMKLITLSSDDTQWQVLGPYSEIGCQSPYSPTNTPKGIAYLSKGGVYVFDGKSSQLISDIVTTTVNDVLWTARSDVAGVYHKNEYQMAYTSVESGAANNDSVLVFDMQRDAYVIDDKNINVFEVFSSGTDEGTLYSGESGAGGAILAHTDVTGTWIYKTQTGFESGTYDDTDVFGTEASPILRLSWNKAFDGAEFAGKGFDHADYATSTFERRDLSGTWSSPITEINASNLDKIYWNEELGTAGDITFAIRLGATSGAAGAASYSSEFTDPSGSDISGITANNFAQIRATLTTTDISLTPDLVRLNNFNVKVVYSKEGSSAETAVPTVYKTGMIDLGIPKNRKRLWEIILYYTGTSGDLNFTITDVNGDVSKTFILDLSIEPGDSDTDNYEGTNLGKKYTHIFPNDGTNPVAEFFQYQIDDDGIPTWTIQKIRTRFSVEELY